MRRKLSMVRTLSLFVCFGIVVSAASAEAACLANGAAFKGELREVRTRLADGKLVVSIQLVVPVATCARVEETGTDPIQITGIRSVEILPKRGAAANFLGLIGAKATFKGKFGIPADGSGTADVVLADAEMVSADRKPAVVADQVPPDQPSDLIEQPAVDPNVADNAPAAAGEQAAPDPRLNSAGMADRLKRFVTDFYLAPDALTAPQLRAIYAENLEYFGGQRVSVERVIADKLHYFQRWPDRQFRLVAGTLDVNHDRAKPSVYHVSFEYDFAIAGPGRQSSGRGFGLLSVDLALGQGQIVRETGEILQSQ